MTYIKWLFHAAVLWVGAGKWCGRVLRENPLAGELVVNLLSLRGACLTSTGEPHVSPYLTAITRFCHVRDSHLGDADI
jgi:hypothetical protein